MLNPPKAILVPTDFSQFSDNALQYALDIAAQYSVPVFLIHVLDQKVYSDHTITLEMIEGLRQKRLETAEKKLMEEIAKFPAAGSVAVTPIARTGLAPVEILRATEELGIDLIVIASHGQTGLMSLLAGSVAGKVAQTAKCPVLIVRSQPA